MPTSGDLVTIHISAARDADAIDRKEDQPVGARGPIEFDGSAAKGGGAKVADGSVSKRVETLEEVQATLSMISNAVYALQVVVANQIEQERAGDDGIPLDVYAEAAAEGALDNDFAPDAIDAAEVRAANERDAREDCAAYFDMSSYEDPRSRREKAYDAAVERELAGVAR